MQPPWHLVLVFISFFENCYGLRCAYAAGLSPERLCHGPHGSGVIAPRTLLSLGLGLRCPITALALHQHYILPPRGLIASAQTGLNGARLAFTAYKGSFRFTSICRPRSGIFVLAGFLDLYFVVNKTIYPALCSGSCIGHCFLRISR